jgi:hypothetical protein
MLPPVPALLFSQRYSINQQHRTVCTQLKYGVNISKEEKNSVKQLCGPNGYAKPQYGS